MSMEKKGSTEKAAREAAAPVEKAKEKGARMYLGPTITGVARHGMVFKDGILPERAGECIAKFPQMSRLFVELGKAPEAAMELRKKRGALAVIYNQAAKCFSGQKF